MAFVKKEVQEHLCDVCGDHANGSWIGAEWLNGNVYAEYYYPIDLCEEHMEVFAVYFTDFAKERYEGSSEEDKINLIQKVKEKSSG